MSTQNIKMPSTADLAAMWNASGLKNKIIFIAAAAAVVVLSVVLFPVL